MDQNLSIWRESLYALCGRIKLGLSFRNREGATSFQKDKVCERNFRGEIRTVRRKQDLDGAFGPFDLPVGRLPEELHQAKLPLRVKMRFGFLDQQQRESFGFLAQQQELTCHEQ